MYPSALAIQKCVISFKAFDIDPSKHNQRFAVPVFSLEELENFVKYNIIKTGIISVNNIAAQHTLDIMVNAGIEGVLNLPQSN